MREKQKAEKSYKVIKLKNRNEKREIRHAGPKGEPLGSRPASLP